MKVIEGGNINPTGLLTYYTCNVCGVESRWTENHAHVERPIGTGYSAGEEQFITCSDDCRNSDKEKFILWLGNKDGCSLKSARQNYEECIEPYKKNKTRHSNEKTQNP